MRKVICMIMLFVFFISSVTMVEVAAAASPHNGKSNDVLIKTHVRDLGWKGPFREGETAGTTGQGRGIQDISISIVDDSKIVYRVYVDGLGWTDWVNSGTELGTASLGKAITAIQIYSNGEGKDVHYKVHVAMVGWMDWITENAGTAGVFDKQIEAIVIKLEEPAHEYYNDTFFDRVEKY